MEYTMGLNSQQAQALKIKYGADYHQRIGKLGGLKSGGFSSTKLDKNGNTGRQRAALAGRKSKRWGSSIKSNDINEVVNK